MAVQMFRAEAIRPPSAGRVSLTSPWQATKLKHVNATTNGDGPNVEVCLPPGFRCLFVTTPNGLESGRSLPPTYSAPPINFLWLAAILRQFGADVRIIRPAYVLRRLTRIRSVYDLRFATKIGWDFLRSKVGYRA